MEELVKKSIDPWRIGRKDSYGERMRDMNNRVRNHPKLKDIQRKLLAGVKLTVISHEFGVSTAALARYRDREWALVMAAAMADDVGEKGKIARGMVMDLFAIIKGTAEEARAAKQFGDVVDLVAVGDKLARTHGEIEEVVNRPQRVMEAPATNVNVNNQRVMNIIQTPKMSDALPEGADVLTGQGLKKLQEKIQPALEGEILGDEG